MSRDANRARSGAISLVSSVVARSKGKRQHSDAEDRKRAATFRSGMQTAFMRAREFAQGDQAEKFFAGVKRIALFEANRFARQPVGFDYLLGLQEPAPLPIDREISWLSHRIKSSSPEITRYLQDRERVEGLFLTGEFKSSLFELDAHIDREGASLWAVSLKIGLLQIVHGVEAQKAYVGDIRSTYKHAILPYLANTFSQRAEGEVSIGYYLENARRRIERIKSADIATYLKFKVEEVWPSSSTAVATILRIEQNHHQIDIYETFLGAVGHLVANGLSGKLKRTVQSALQNLAGLPDSRLGKMLFAISGEPLSTTFERSSSAAMEQLLRGDICCAYQLSLGAYTKSPKPSSILVGAIARSHGRQMVLRRSRIKGAQVSSRTLYRELVASLVAVIARREAKLGGESSEAAWTAKKLGHVLGGLSFFQSLRCVTDAEEASAFSLFCAHIARAAYSSGEISILDGFSSFRAVGVEIAAENEGALKEFQRRLRGQGNFEPSSCLRADAAAYADACSNLRAGEIEAVEAVVPVALKSPSRMLAAHAASVALESYAESGQIGLASELIASEHVNGGTSIGSLPVVPVFEGADWSRLEEYSSSISLSISLYIFAQLGNEDTTHSYRCFALETFLLAKGVARPSELKEQVRDFDPDQLAFFLGRACEWSLLDMLPSISSTREVLEERRDICALLLQMKGIRGAEAYRQELLAVTKELMVQQGLQTIDGSRVHVDIDALRIALRRELAESHSRYMSLIKQGVGVSEDFDTVLRDIVKQEGQPKYLLSIPQNEADELLYEMIRQVRERFLFDIPHGLDSYLSKRIRHGSVVGYLRGPAEKEGMIAAQNLDGSYKPSEKWAGIIAATPRKADLEAAFQNFARSFDDHLMRLKDVKLHVRSDQHPLGVFDAPMGTPLFHVIRSVTSRDASLQAFIDTLLASLWGLLNPSLVAARDLLLKDTARALAEMFDGLRKSIADLVPPSADRVELDLAAGRASASVQASVQTVAAWFTPLEGDDCDYSLNDVVEIALASVQAIAASFQPSLEVREEPEHRIGRGVMLLIVDALFIAFQNIARWAGSNDPSVVVSVSSDEVAEVIRIRIVNSVSGIQNFKAEQRRIHQMKEKLFTPEGVGMARREGGSGFFKLASIIGQATSGRLDFGYVSAEEFFVEFDLSLPSMDDSRENSAR